MVKIRLTQTGSRNRKTYRIVVQEEAKRRDADAIEILGFYNPLVKPAQLSVKRERVDYWLGKGAQMTDGVSRILTDKKA